jgi:transcription-repair coupling factor (superfamily II helicase)
MASDFLKLCYRDGDTLYVPVDRMDMVQKYMGVEGIEPALDKLGGKTWQRTRAKAKESAERIANELLELYAARRMSRGHAFSPPDSYYKDFEAGFPFEETADQLKAIDDVLTDMERERPMDRLICGDVGYGKPKSPCGPPSSRSMTANRWPCWFRPRFLRSSTMSHFPNGLPGIRSMLTA